MVLTVLLSASGAGRKSPDRSSRLGLQAESLSRALQRLSREHLISVHGSHVEILNEQGLLQLNHASH